MCIAQGFIYINVWNLPESEIETWIKRKRTQARDKCLAFHYLNFGKYQDYCREKGSWILWWPVVREFVLWIEKLIVRSLKCHLYARMWTILKSWTIMLIMYRWVWCRKGGVVSNNGRGLISVVIRSGRGFSQWAWFDWPHNGRGLMGHTMGVIWCAWFSAVGVVSCSGRDLVCVVHHGRSPMLRLWPSLQCQRLQFSAPGTSGSLSQGFLWCTDL